MLQRYSDLAAWNRRGVTDGFRERDLMTLPLDDFLRIAKALADGRRFAILECIARSGDTACQRLCEEFPVSQPTMSHHLRVLVDVGLIEMRRDGQYAHYRLRAETVRAYTATVESRLGTSWGSSTGRTPQRRNAAGRNAQGEH